ncbi:GNAT family protein [Paenibacillus sp. FSL K6-1096]|uniref:GNAT family N-acetyltransferase n=1 Tax=Paenibacillus sp. FSL K6-1096 TaxID=2921460 RepID=UPI0030EE7C02
MQHSNKVYAATERLMLRHFEIQDVNALYQYRSDPEIARFQSWENYTYEAAEAFVQAQIAQKPDEPGTWLQYAIALADSNQLIGDCAVHTLQAEPRMVEIGYTLAPEHQGKGYVHEALGGLFGYIFDTLDKHKIIAFTDVRNGKSIRVLERKGMRREGHLLQNYWSKGSWTDEYQYALLASEWRNR